jgi:hypothetical protein
MLKAKVGEVPVITGGKLLVGVINIEAIAREKTTEGNVRDHMKSGV